jgi:hypothetical protein
LLVGVGCCWFALMVGLRVCISSACPRIVCFVFDLSHCFSFVFFVIRSIDILTNTSHIFCVVARVVCWGQLVLWLLVLFCRRTFCVVARKPDARMCLRGCSSVCR